MERPKERTGWVGGGGRCEKFLLLHKNLSEVKASIYQLSVLKDTLK
jgi:hypothetical protein